MQSWRTPHPTAAADATCASHLDNRQVRVLAHPLRMRLLGSLRVDGPATATTLAELLGTNTGATSYHLRQLAEVGLVAEDPDRGTGRQRWWQAAHDVSHFDPTDFDDDPDARAAVAVDPGATRCGCWSSLAERWLAAQHDQSPAWRDAFGMSDLVHDHSTAGPAARTSRRSCGRC